jgi:heterodisulfide reductase subunit B
MKYYSYFPGCSSAHGGTKAYDLSTKAVAKVLETEFAELEDWNCCGSTPYSSVDELASYCCSARNLALAEKRGFDLVTPCSACYVLLNKTNTALKEYPELRSQVKEALAAGNLEYNGTVKVRHLLDVFVNDIGYENIKSRVKVDLKGLKVAPYYGCQIVRPYATFDDQHNPTTMDRLLETLGATVIKYPLKTKCCGGSLTGTVPEAGLKLAYILLNEAQKRGADVIVTVCPLCQFNLDGYHDKIEAKWGSHRLPVVYFTQLMGLAFGIPARQLGLHRGFVPMKPLPVATAAAA